MFHVRAHFALVLYDDFSGKPIRDRGCMFALNGRPVRPLIKPEGYYVFSWSGPQSVQVSATCQGYRTAVTSVSLDALSPSDPVVPVRMYRSGRWYPDCDLLEGRVPAADVQVYAFVELRPALCLTGEHKKGSQELRISGYGHKSLLQMPLSVGGGKARELLLPVRRLSEGLYRLRFPLKGTHPDGEWLLRAYSAYADSEGLYRLPVDFGVPVDQVQYQEREGRKWVCLSVPAPR